MYIFSPGNYDCGSDDENRSLTLKQTLEMMSEELDRKIEQVGYSLIELISSPGLEIEFIFYWTAGLPKVC